MHVRARGAGRGLPAGNAARLLTIAAPVTAESGRAGRNRAKPVHLSEAFAALQYKCPQKQYASLVANRVHLRMIRED